MKFRYTILFVVAFVIAALVCHFGQLMPWYFLFGSFEYKNMIKFDKFDIVAVGIAFIFVLPTGIVQAVTNQSIGKQTSLSEIRFRTSVRV